MKFSLDGAKLWWGMAVLAVVVLVAVNIYLIWLRNAIFTFIGDEARLSNERTLYIIKFRSQ